jgi:hypothetical protein
MVWAGRTGHESGALNPRIALPDQLGSYSLKIIALTRWNEIATPGDRRHLDEQGYESGALNLRIALPDQLRSHSLETIALACGHHTGAME